MIVRDAGAHWQIVMQTDHADLSRDLARAWGERGERHDSLVVEGDDADHVLPPPELDPFTPEPAPPEKARNVMWLAVAIVAVIVLVVLYTVLH